MHTHIHIVLYQMRVHTMLPILCTFLLHELHYCALENLQEICDIVILLNLTVNYRSRP